MQRVQWSGYRDELRRLFRLAAPLAAAQAGTQLMGVVDIAVLGRYSARDLAACGLANAFFFAISVAGMGVVFGIDPLISQAVGAGDKRRARRVLWQGVWLALIVAGVLTIPLLLSLKLMPLFGVTRELIQPATEYLVVRTTGLVPFLLFFVVRSYLQAHHQTRALVLSMIVCNVFNLIADIILVFGWGPIPSLGAAGAAIATVAGNFIQLGIVVWGAGVLTGEDRKSAGEDTGAPLHKWNGPEVLLAFRLGLPVGLQMAAEVGVFALVGLLAGRLGTLQLAAHQVVIIIASFTFTIAVGVASAGSVRVGIAIGARDPVRTRMAGHTTFIAAACVMAVAAILFALIPESLSRLLTNDRTVIEAAIPLFFVAAFFQLSDGVQAAGAGVLRGAADTRYAFLANLFGHWVIGLPIALYLGFRAQMGVVGLWWGLSAGLTVVAILLFVRFERLSSTGIAPV
jgi:MATE family multidrug resistance protein